MPPRTAYSTQCQYRLDADWSLRSDDMPNSRLQVRPGVPGTASDVWRRVLRNDDTDTDHGPCL